MLSIEQYGDFRQVLRHRLEQRCQRNLRYSLRSFARDLGLSPARLSEILKGKQGLSLKWAKHVAERLGMNEREKIHFCDLVESQHARSPARRELARLRISQSDLAGKNQLNVDAFKMISDWYHLAILSLAELSEFQSDPGWIASRLGIPLILVSPAIERLVELGQLERNEVGELRVATDATFVGSGVPSEALKKFHQQVLEKAAVAIYEQDLQTRDFSSGFIAIKKESVPVAKKYLEEMRDKFWKLMANTGDSEVVYCLQTSFFKIDQGDKK